MVQISPKVQNAVARRLMNFDRIDPDWERPTPSVRELSQDLICWVAVLVVSLVWNLAFQSLGIYEKDGSAWKGYLAITVMTIPLIWRRKYPISMLMLATTFFYILGYMSTQASATMSFQLSYLVIIYSALAWAKNRQAVWIAYALVCISALVWFIATWTINGSVYFYGVDENKNFGILSVPTAAFISTILINVLYFGSGAALGRAAWHHAFQQSVLVDQAEQLRCQSAQMAKDAVTRDRLRIARELHDSVGHHVSVMGIQAAAARAVMLKNPESALHALGRVENLSREAVREMKFVLMVLRSDEESSHETEPQIADLERLVEQTTSSQLHVDLFGT